MLLLLDNSFFPEAEMVCVHQIFKAASWLHGFLNHFQVCQFNHNTGQLEMRRALLQELFFPSVDRSVPTVAAGDHVDLSVRHAEDQSHLDNKIAFCGQPEHKHEQSDKHILQVMGHRHVEHFFDEEAGHVVRVYLQAGDTGVPFIVHCFGSCTVGSKERYRKWILQAKGSFSNYPHKIIGNIPFQSFTASRDQNRLAKPKRKRAAAKAKGVGDDNNNAPAVPIKVERLDEQQVAAAAAPAIAAPQQQQLENAENEDPALAQSIRELNVIFESARDSFPRFSPNQRLLILQTMKNSVLLGVSNLP